MSPPNTYVDFAERNARLIVLEELQKQVDGRLNEAMISHVLETFGYRRGRDWTRTQLRRLADLNAIAIAEVGDYLIAEIRQGGIDHVERRALIEGIAKPSPPR